MVFDQVQYIGINLRLKCGPWSISSHYKKPLFSPAVIEFLVLIIKHKPPLMTLCCHLLISSYFELTFIPSDFATSSLNWYVLIVALYAAQCCDKCCFSPRHERTARLCGVNTETCCTVDVSPWCVSACELQDPTACVTLRGPCCPHTFHTPISLRATPCIIAPLMPNWYFSIYCHLPSLSADSVLRVALHLWTPGCLDLSN